MRGKWYFGIGFRNRKGGMEIRNPYFKGSTSPKDISHVRHSTDKNERTAVLVFEGFMDYLSYLALKQGQPVPDCVVLNSVGNLPGALDVLKGYGHVCCFLDNDDAGRRTTEEIRRRCGSVTDKAVHYLPHKDLNEFLQAPSEKDGGNVCGAETGKRVKNKKITVWTGISFDEKLLPVLQTFFAKEKVPAYTGCILPYKRTGGISVSGIPFSFTPNHK